MKYLDRANETHWTARKFHGSEKPLGSKMAQLRGEVFRHRFRETSLSDLVVAQWAWYWRECTTV